MCPPAIQVHQVTQAVHLLRFPRLSLVPRLVLEGPSDPARPIRQHKSRLLLMLSASLSVC